MSPELYYLKNINELDKIIIEKSNSFTIDIVLLRMILLLDENIIKDLNKY